MGMMDAKNKVPELQRVYQAAYRNHTRIWRISPRSRMMLIPFNIVLYGSLAANMYAMGRKILGYNTWFSKD